MAVIHVVMAVHLPDLCLLKRQLGSLTAQTGVRLNIHVALDGPQPDGVQEVLRDIHFKPLEILTLPEHGGPRMCFFAGLEGALAASHKGDLYAFCDQDDFWHPEKLRRQLQVIEATGAPLVTCDARVVDREGSLIHRSLHEMEQRSHSNSLSSYIMMNSVTGMTSLFNRASAELALAAGSDSPAGVLHDHWVAIAASLLGEVIYLDEQLVDYTQHGRNYLGASDRSKHRINPAVFAKPRHYVSRCREQYLHRVDLLRRIQKLAGRGEWNFRHDALAGAERLFAGNRGSSALAGFSLAALLRGERRLSRMAFRCLIGKAAKSLGTDGAINS